VLDSLNSGWTVYDTANSGLPDNFVHTVAINGDERWFGTLGGGVAHLATNSDAWTVLNTDNSLLPEDDVLAVAIDANDGQWFATFDIGLSYHGPLPATPPLFNLDPVTAPDYTPGQAKGYYLWLDPQTYLWHLAWSGDGLTHTFSGDIIANAPIISATTQHFEPGESINLSGNTLSLVATTETISQDMIIFALDRTATELTLDLRIDDAYYPFNIHLGQADQRPATAPFRLVPPQPSPPQVQVEVETPLAEGEYVYITAALTDTDSPLDHQINWTMGDGTTYTDTLAPAHTYLDNGLYQVTLAITDVHNESSVTNLPLTVTNVAPEANFYYDPSRPEPGQLITFYGSLFDPGQLDTHTYAWDFGDGVTTTNSLTVTHSYAITGDYEVTLTANDDDGGTGAISYTVSVEPFGADLTGYPGVGLPPFTATFYDVSVGQVTSRTWTFGDGSPAVTTNTTNIEHRYDTPGIYDVSLTATGPSGTDAITRPGYIIAVSPETSSTIILEAEDYTRQVSGAGPTWETRTAGPDQVHFGYAGSGYVQANPDIDVIFDLPTIDAGSELQYDLGLTITGSYTVWLRGYAINAAGDSVYVGLNYQPITTTDYISEFPPHTWAWIHTLAESSQPATFTIDYPGVHTLHLWIREDGFSIDQIILTTDESFDPGG
ncbi:MAG: PKD domain-containing protein, partial [Gammaproteobacteria bacterium]|nr:PKD domain-containing protein [Gammaproteobacteria bacterium]